MKRVFYQLFLLVLSILLVACTNKSTTEPSEKAPEKEPPSEVETPEDDESEDPSKDSPSEEAISMHDFFLNDGAKAHYEGVGIEFAELDIEVHRIDEDYVVVDENNGGVLLRTMYKVLEDQIVILSEEPIDLDVPLPSSDELAALDPIEVYFKMPIEVGTTFDGWEIIDVDATVETPYDTFEQAIVIEKTESETTTKKYFVEQFGEVKRESVMDLQEEGEMDEYAVSSSLESIQ